MIGMQSIILSAIADAGPSGASVADLIRTAYAGREPPKHARDTIRTMVSRARTRFDDGSRRIATVRRRDAPTVYRIERGGRT